MNSKVTIRIIQIFKIFDKTYLYIENVLLSDEQTKIDLAKGNETNKLLSVNKTFKVTKM